MSSTNLKISACGGYGVFGQNCTVYRYADHCIIVDTGIRFDDEPNIRGSLITDLDFLEEYLGKIAYVFTHAHEDHIGGITGLWDRYQGPIYSTSFTSGILARRFGGLIEKSIECCENGKVYRHGELSFEFLSVSHSIPDANAVLIGAPKGRILHTGDFKLAPSLQKNSTLAVCSQITQLKDIDILISDSTNAGVPGYCPSEKVVVNTIKNFLCRQLKPTIISCFSSNVGRIEAVAKQAGQNGYAADLTGTSLKRMTENTLKTGWASDQTTLSRLLQGPSKKQKSLMRLSFMTGCQAEPQAALNRLSQTTPQENSLRVILSSRPIPGNEVPIRALVQRLRLQGIEVIDCFRHPGVHVSGHAYQEDIRSLAALTRPKFFVPMHGDTGMQAAAINVVRDFVTKDRCRLVHEGSTLEFDGEQLWESETFEKSFAYLHQTHGRVVSAVDLIERATLQSYGALSIALTICRKSLQTLTSPALFFKGGRPADANVDLLSDALLSAVNFSLSEIDNLSDEAGVESMLREVCFTVVKQNLKPFPVVLCQIVFL
jgi:ribonuclease J